MANGSWRYHSPQVRRQCRWWCRFSLSPYLVSSENGLSSPVCLGTVSPAHRPREDRPGAKTDTYISIFSTCQPENHLLLLLLSPDATAYSFSHLWGQNFQVHNQQGFGRLVLVQSSHSLRLKRGRERLWEAWLPGLQEKGLLNLGRTPGLVACATHSRHLPAVPGVSPRAFGTAHMPVTRALEDTWSGQTLC